VKSGSKDSGAGGRFEKGRSGNPAGRPKKARAAEASAFEVIIDKTLTVVQSGVPREMTAEEALQHRTYQEAIAGSRMAQRTILKMITKREKERAAKFDVPKVQVTFRSYEEDPSNADEALQILGIAKRKELQDGRQEDRDYLLLEPWAVQAALSRRRGGHRLEKKEIDEVTRCTRDPDKLRWPRKSER
jgi:hypothetical protein